MFSAGNIRRKFAATVESAKDGSGQFCEKAERTGMTGWPTAGVVSVLAIPTLFYYGAPDSAPLEEKRLIQADDAYKEASSALERLAQKKRDYLKQSSALVNAQVNGDFEGIEAAKNQKKFTEAKIEQDKRILFGKAFLDPSISEKQLVSLLKAYQEMAAFGSVDEYRTVGTPEQANAANHRDECLAKHPVDPGLSLDSNIASVTQCMVNEKHKRSTEQVLGGALSMFLGGLLGFGAGAGFESGVNSGAVWSRRRREEKERLKKEHPGRFGNN